jgi:hypothetical protein
VFAGASVTTPVSPMFSVLIVICELMTALPALMAAMSADVLGYPVLGDQLFESSHAAPTPPFQL